MTEIIDEECWDCLHFDGEGETLDTFKHICLKGLPFAKLKTPCSGYEWNEVNDKPWYENE
jgi:hypothetical protein